MIVTRTFSKIYGLAGLRIGYGVSSPELASVIQRVRHPFNANLIALAAAEAALEKAGLDGAENLAGHFAYLAMTAPEQAERELRAFGERESGEEEAPYEPEAREPLPP